MIRSLSRRVLNGCADKSGEVSDTFMTKQNACPRLRACVKSYSFMISNPFRASSVIVLALLPLPSKLVAKAHLPLSVSM